MGLLERREAVVRGSKRVHFFSTFFMTKLVGDLRGYCYDNVRRWTKSVDIFEMGEALIPVHLGGVHWVCVRIAPPLVYSTATGLDHPLL